MRDLLFWHGIYELQVTEDEIVNEYRYPSSGKPKTLPPPIRMRVLVEERLRSRRKKLEAI